MDNKFNCKFLKCIRCPKIKEEFEFVINNIIKNNKKIGKDGKDGLNGQDGKSAYQIALDYGFIGDEKQWLNSFKCTCKKEHDD